VTTFERVGKALRRTGKTHAGRQRSLLGGLVVCGRCGSKLTHKSRTSGGTKVRTYACASDSAEKCGRLRVLADPVERIAADTAFANFDFGRVGPRPDASGDAEVQLAQERLQELAEAEADITDERVKGSLTGSAFLRAIRAISDERTALEGELRSLERKSQPLWTLGDTQVFIGPPDTFSRLSPDEMEWWRTLVGAVFKQIIIDPAGKGRRFRPERVRLVPNPGFKAAKRGLLREVPTQAGVWKKVTYD
jgi:hypothetical protein